MKNYKWQGVNLQGYRVYGELLGNNAQEITKKLRQRKITPLKIQCQITIWKRSHKKISYLDISLLVREIASLNSAGLSLFQTLDIVYKNANKSIIKDLLAEIQESLTRGRYLSETLRDYPQYFDTIFSSLIEVGEKSGTLDRILNNIALQRDKILLIKKKVRKALLYPSIVLIISLIISIGLLLFVVPQFEKLFNSVGAKLPMFTRMIIAVTHGLANYAIYIVIGWLLIIFLFRLIYKNYQSFQAYSDFFLLKIPLLGKLLQQAIISRCFRVLAISLSAGLTLLNALCLVQSLASNKLYIKAFIHTIEQIKAGQTLHQSLLQTKIFPQRVLQMIAVGEQAGCLEHMLEKLADYYEQELGYVIDNLTQLIEPAIVIFLALVIGSLVIAMYLPIFRLGSVI